MSNIPRIRLVTILVLAAALASIAVPVEAQPGPWKQYAAPEEAGFSSEKLADARAAAEALKSAAAFAVYKGRVLAAWGDPSRRIELHSVRKSLVSALYGPAVSSGKIDLAKTLADIGIEDREPLSAGEKRARIADLLMAKSGVYHPAAKEPADMKKGRPARGSHPPGTFFWYNNWDFNTAGVIFERLTGTGVFEAFGDTIAVPTGMEDFRIGDGYAQYERSLSNHPAHAFRMSARDLARFGTLFANGGKVDGRQIIPESWVKDSTSIHTPDVRPGTSYGYMWWIYPKGGLGEKYPALDRYDKFAATGTGGQLVLVVPEAEFVFIHLADTDAGQNVGGSAIWGVAERVLAAKTREAKPDPALADVKAEPYAQKLPSERDWTTVPVSPGVLARYAGDFTTETGLKLSFQVVDGVLVGTLAGQGEADFFPRSETEFFAKAAAAEVKFEVGESGGTADRLTLRYGGRDHPASRVK
jgi:CubicO group peptidase (beta-lactamase class C family)